MIPGTYEYQIILVENATFNGIESQDLRQSNKINLAIHLANTLAHKGATEDRVHRFLHNQTISPAHVGHAWYKASDSSSVHLLNHVAKELFGYSPSEHQFSTRHPINHSDTLPIHRHLTTFGVSEFLIDSYKATQKVMPFGDTVLYRGVNIPNMKTYVPRPIESWTHDPEQSLHMGHTHILTTTVPSHAILWHYNHVGENDNFIPYERDVIVNGENVVIGKHISSVKIHTRNDFIDHHNLKET